MTRAGTKRPAPADLMETWARLKGTDPMARHYKAGRDTVRRWINEAGVNTALGRSFRPTPDDIMAVVGEFGANTVKLAAHYKADRKTVRRWMRESGVDLRQNIQQRPRPDDLMEMRAKLGSVTYLQRHYRASCHTVQRWLAEINAPRIANMPNRVGVSPPNKKPLPDDFASLAPGMTKAELQRHYGAILDTVNRWLAEAGVSSRKYEAQPFVFARGAVRAPIANTKPYGPEDAAADTMRRFMPVYRCTEKGKADHTGTFWRIGNTVLTGEELIARAARKAA